MFLFKKSLPFFRKKTLYNKKVILPLSFLHSPTIPINKTFSNSTITSHNTLQIKKPEIKIFFEKKIRPIEGGDDEIKCHICLYSPILLPTVTNCLHCFCFHCIRHHLNKKNTCPVCDTDIHQLYILED